MIYAVLSCIVVILVALFAWNKRPIERLLKTAYLAIHFVYFLMPILFNDYSYPGRVIDSEFIQKVALYSSISLISLLLGLLSNKNHFSSAILIPIPQQVIFIIGILCVYEILRSALHWPMVGFVKTILNYLPVCLAFLLGIEGFYKKSKFAAFVIVFVILYYLGQSLSSKVIALVLAYFIGRFYSHSVLDFKTIIVFMAFAIGLKFIHERRFNIRNEAAKEWYNSDNGLSDKFVKNLELTTKLLKSSKYESAGSEDINRFELVSLYSQVIFCHEKLAYPYKYGQTFWWLILTPVPRVIFPWKPTNLMATTIAENYGLKKRGENYAVNFPIWVEFYINFGLIGVLILPFFQGLFVNKILNSALQIRGYWSQIAFGLILYPLFVVEGNITLMWGGIITILVVLSLLRKIL